ncbi:HD domain-containing phosphohydrolase [Paramagnetospirillum magneticum]|uniref:Response regulator containing a CheY-like receiver domain and an HD-GYP domain n=1 Tax=Paramagnetospirillum magneticum (strain ATCC 700264 / AMB-1) TaxID=342108 RepID=Q2W315_PARM1|nr:HD domain-containing phosphohydrolase [Paramagnetospirillum magneticum]BAE51760.1 Response regulator containing a CheY-like receiver domain and an HD-GYP domain [Paramagnetospirillum magneticum AMB-1]
MEDRILVIDDDHHLLSGLRRQFNDSFDLTTAQGGAEALEEVQAAMAAQNPFAAVLCDMRMPGMDGIETLKRIRELAPDTVRIMLTGNADQQTAIEAINQGNIFRFYTKPCPTDQLQAGLRAACEQYHLVTAEKELLEKTLTGSIKVLVDVASMNDAQVAGLATRLREWVRLLTIEFKMPQRWQLEIAATLVPVGQVAIPPELITKKRSGEALTELEQSIFERNPEAARNLIAHIPRLAKVSEIVYLQDRGFDGSGFPADGPVGTDIPLDARLLKILKDLAEATEGGPLTKAAFAVLDKRRGQYDPVLLPKVRSCLERVVEMMPSTAVEVPLASLRAGQMVLSDIRLTNGHLILAANTQLSVAQIERLRNLRRIFPFAEPVKVRI